MLTFSNFEQLSNTFDSKLITPLGISISTRPLDLNAPLAIFVTLLGISI